jgi:hypothetical protein
MNNLAKTRWTDSAMKKIGFKIPMLFPIRESIPSTIRVYQKPAFSDVDADESYSHFTNIMSRFKSIGKVDKRNLKINYLAIWRCFNQ